MKWTKVKNVNISSVASTDNTTSNSQYPWLEEYLFGCCFTCLFLVDNWMNEVRWSHRRKIIQVKWDDIENCSCIMWTTLVVPRVAPIVVVLLYVTCPYTLYVLLDQWWLHFRFRTQRGDMKVTSLLPLLLLSHRSWFCSRSNNVKPWFWSTNTLTRVCSFFVLCCWWWFW